MSITETNLKIDCKLLINRNSMLLTYLVSFMLLIAGATQTAYGQLRIVDVPEREIYRSGKNTVYEIGSFELKDGKRKIYYRNYDKEGDNVAFGEIVLSPQDFDDLYTFIINGFNPKADLPIKIDLDDSLLLLHYDKIIGSTRVRIGHAYKSAPYQVMLSYFLRRKDIDKLFDRE